ncbi:peptidylprolyl isomerase [Nocardioides sp. MAHUQ-72]|uniref:peptidylprolyl isomerase n=1 Tax=unclassified Nocardioides TaxID=2615069 RepID=UPI003608657F
MLMRPLTALAALTAVLALAGCSDDSSQDESSAPTREATGKACTYKSDGQQPAKDVDLPPDHAAVSGDEGVTIKTSAGDIEATLDADTTPCTVNSFVSLADQGYFDNTSCHRLTTQGIYVLQCGDPTATGAGTPGYSFPDELSGKETYGPGTLAMANAGADTNGSQFFIVYGDSPLDPDYTVFGTIDDASLQVVKDIADKGTVDGGPDGAPKEKVTIDSVTAE